MDAIKLLRQRAADRRDKAVEAARAEYRRTLHQIDELSASLNCDAPRPSKSKARPILELICGCLPKDKAFTVGEMVEMLRDAHPDRSFSVPTLRTFFPRLADQGVIHKVSRTSSGQVLWAAVGASVEVSPFRAMPATEMAENILREVGPLRLAELVVAMQERGYRADAEPRRLAASLRWSLRQNPSRFQRGDDLRWTVGGQAG